MGTPATALAFQLRRHLRLAHAPRTLQLTVALATPSGVDQRRAGGHVRVRYPPYAQRTCCSASGGCTCSCSCTSRASHAHRDFPRRHARHGAHGRDWHAHGAVLAAARAAQGRPAALPCPARSPATPPARRDVAEVRLQEPSPQTRVGLPRQPCRHRTVRGDRRQGVCLVGEGPTYRASRRGARIG